ncbi:(2Fe-2S)-binding protein [Chengkuizengella axinellae]|uniref:(2Fe-2S)-binding protein n=1 Tax=Chengkuizengella axinellae TaxID=3064388 RepID=A0ABT9J1N7_9BACL|nr:(2Fe-2S)-binding protein [Chengkuizengella sp. 2205SS18-9]MDP5275531.1 (2Fe-2S)-binding protein [Chengkuizengella sp. 2205SS18-9]
MSKGRIIDHPILGRLDEREEVHFTFDENKLIGYEGETIAAALLANGERVLRCHEETGKLRGIYCNIGHCMECRVNVGNQKSVRACLTVIQEGMEVKSGRKLPTPFKKGETQ